MKKERSALADHTPQVWYDFLKQSDPAAAHVLPGQKEADTQKPVSFAFTLKPSLSGWESKSPHPGGASEALGGHAALLQIIKLSFYLFSMVREGHAG